MQVKVGVIGCGSIARHRHLPELAANPDAQIAAVCDIVRSRADEMADKYHATAYYDYRSMLAEAELDAVVVCNTNVLHAETAIDALLAGKHVLCEKPMAVTVEEAKDMIRTAGEAGKYLMIGYNQRLVPTHIKAKEILQSGILGKVLTFRTVFGHRGCEYWAIDGRDTWFFQRKHVAFGTSADLGIHKVDLVQWMLEDDFMEVSAFAGTLAKRNGKEELIDVDDNLICLLKTEKGVFGTMTASWTYAREDNSTVFYCEKGVMKILGDPQYDLVLEMNDNTATYHRIGGIQTNTKQTKSGIPDLFIHSVVNGCKPEISGEEGQKALRVILACLESSIEKKTVTV